VQPQKALLCAERKHCHITYRLLKSVQGWGLGATNKWYLMHAFKLTENPQNYSFLCTIWTPSDAWFLGITDRAHQMASASRSVQPFSQSSRPWLTDTQTDRPRYSVCSSKPLSLAIDTMRPNKRFRNRKRRSSTQLQNRQDSRLHIPVYKFHSLAVHLNFFPNLTPSFRNFACYMLIVLFCC